MKQTLLLMVLALGMCNINVSAQEREYKVGNDGFEWYEVKRVVNGETKYGAEDRYGNMIVPTEYDVIYYDDISDNPIKTGFRLRKGKYGAWYSKSGKCVVPYSRGYTHIFKYDEEEFGTYYRFAKFGGGGILDKNGREVVSVKADGLYFIKPDYMKLKGRTYYWLWIGIEKDGEKFDGIADATGKIIVRPEYKDASTAFDLAKSRLTTTTNPLAGNRHETLAEAEGRSSSSSSSSSSSISSDKNSGNKTTTIVVEHQHTPQPTQEWQQCTSCWGSGNCRNCAGSGTNYIGSSLKRCSMCGGSGRCTTCSGRGGKNITVYR